MGQQISVEAALPVFRQRCSELQDENLLLKARINELEEELEKARAGQGMAPEAARAALGYAGVDSTE
jgi:cell division protein FtsB